VESIVKLTFQLEEHSSFSDVVNVGGSQRYSMLELIEAVENAFGSKIDISFEDVFSADVNETWADTTYLESLIEFKPKLIFEEESSHSRNGLTLLNSKPTPRMEYLN